VPSIKGHLFYQVVDLPSALPGLILTVPKLMCLRLKATP